MFHSYGETNYVIDINPRTEKQNTGNKITNIHSLITNPSYFVVDIGASTCSVNDPVFSFITNDNFCGLCIEGSKQNEWQLQQNVSKTFDIHIGYITPYNIIDVFQRFNVPIELDILKIDIDGYDLEVLRKVLEIYKPKIIIAEINEKIPPPILFEVKYKDNYEWDYSHCFGFSIASGEKVLSRFGYKIDSIYELNNILCVDNELSYLLDKADVATIYKNEYVNNRSRIATLPWNENVNHWLEITDKVTLYNEIVTYFTTNNNRSVFQNKNKTLDIDFSIEIE